jgi:CRISPR-associated protein Csm4
MNRVVYRLTFTAPLHVDGQGTGFYQASDAFIHSDTLSAALLSVWAKLQPADLNNWFNDEQHGQPPFLLSSAFPYYFDPQQQQTPLYLLPRPIHTRAVQLDKTQLRLNKKIKKIKWLELDIWQQVINQRWNWVTNPTLTLPGGILVNTAQDQLFPNPVSFTFWAEEERTRVTLDRSHNNAIEGQLFHFARIHYHPHSGLYFLVDFTDNAIQPTFEGVLSWLGDSGIGADRTCGHGSFTWQRGELELPKAVSNRPVVALSLVAPSPEDLQNKDNWLKETAAYDLIKRGGWITETTLRKPATRFFSEGSYFNSPLQGQMVKLGKHPHGHTVFRDGRGFWVGV